MNQRVRDGLILGGVLLLAVLTRWYGFASAPFRSDEFFTVDQVVHNTYGLKPAYYFLTGLLFQAFGVSEWSARIVAVLLGIVGIVAVYFLGRRLFGATVGWMAALLTTASGWHLYYSQFSRFYSGVFCFGALAYWTFYEALRRGSLPLLLLALLWNGIGILFHTSAAVVPATCALFSLGVLIWGTGVESLYSRRVARLYALICGIAGVAAIPSTLFLIGYRETMGESWGYATPQLALQLVKYVGPPLVAAAIGGILLLGRRGPWKAAYLAVGIAGAVGFLLGMGRIGNVRPDYTFYALPLWLVSGAVFCAELGAMPGAGRLASATALGVLLIGMLPEFASEYTSRRTLDPREAIRYVEQSYQPGDKIVNLLGGGSHYWDARYPVEDLPGTAYHEDIDWLKLLEPYRDPGQRLWVVVPLRRQEIARSLRRWLAENASLVWERQATRYDYTVDAVQIFLKR